MGQLIYLQRYQATKIIGEGGMGKVYLGRDLQDGKIVVIKVMHDEIATNPKTRQAFVREMELMKRFRHPYAVTLFDASFEGDTIPCIIMEFVPGDTLDSMIEKERRLKPEQVGNLLSQLCQAMDAAHNNGIIHRDLTPVNVMVMNPGNHNQTVKVMDFGLAQMGSGLYISLEKLLGDSKNIGGGTPDYVSPEQIRGEAIDHRADIYSLGVLLFKCLTGFLPFERFTETPDILTAHRDLAPPTFSEIGVSSHFVPKSVERVVQDCLSKYPNERPENMIEVLRAYERALNKQFLVGEPVPATIFRPPPIRQRVSPDTFVDEMEAWMPEPIAIVKLRGFAHDLGGDIISSEPGLIRVRLADPFCVPVSSGKSLFSMFKRNKKSDDAGNFAILDLHLELKSTNGQKKIFITATIKPESDPRKAFDPEWQEWCRNISRDLKAYLISG